jgi:hypothetical protein
MSSSTRRCSARALTAPRRPHHVHSVAQTFALCLGRLDREREVDRLALALVARMACMAPGEPVPRQLLAKTMEDVDPLLRADGLRRLGAVGLVEEGEGWLRLHRLLVHFVRQDGLNPDVFPAVVGAVIGYAGKSADGLLTGQELATVISHSSNWRRRLMMVAVSDGLVAELCRATGRALRAGGDLVAARLWHKRALAIRQRVLGPDHPLTAEALNNLGVVLREHGQLATAVALYKRALAIRERVLGPDHIDTAVSLNNLAVALWDQGELTKPIAG